MTLTREANVSVTTTTEMLYCIEHERMVAVEDGGHQFINGGWDYGEVEVCVFPKGWAYCPPPDEPVELTLFDGDWAAQDDPENEEGFWLEGVE